MRTEGPRGNRRQDPSSAVEGEVPLLRHRNMCPSVAQLEQVNHGPSSSHQSIGDETAVAATGVDLGAADGRTSAAGDPVETCKTAREAVGGHVPPIPTLTKSTEIAAEPAVGDFCRGQRPLHFVPTEVWQVAAWVGSDVDQLLD